MNIWVTSGCYVALVGYSRHWLLSDSISYHDLEVPKVVVSCLSLRNLIMGLWLSCMDDIRKLNSALNEENGYVVANNIPIALLSVELDSKSTKTSQTVSALPRLPSTVENRRNTGVSLEVSVRTPTDVTSAALSMSVNFPKAPVPRAWMTRSEIHS